MTRFSALREQYPEFTYRGYKYELINNTIEIKFEFLLGSEIQFTPGYSIPVSEKCRALIVENSEYRSGMEELIFQLGMIETISYWKAACSPKLRVEAGYLSKNQAAWWQQLFYNGLGEFLYLNKINIAAEQLLEIASTHTQKADFIHLEQKQKYLIPIGGGKDSALGVEILSEYSGETFPIAMNPDQAIRDVIETSRNNNPPIFFKRHFDRRLIDLNQQGFLNGHTPFSALIAFATTLVGYLNGIPNIALSNESSANEPTIPGTNINHQYSKSLEFENSFRKYIQDNIGTGFNYFSLLRPLNELQIAALFSRHPKFLDVFRSCNVGSKTNSWCGNCPKCLFTNIILAPFIDEDQLFRIFGKNLMHDELLMPILEELAGFSNKKPFECVGTIDEVNAALSKVINNYNKEDLPVLLKNIQKHTEYQALDQTQYESIIKNWEQQHNLDPQLELFLKQLLNEVTS